MVCTCSCGKEYGFEPMGYWFCHRCWCLNDSGRISAVASESIIEPDVAEGMLRSETDFHIEADSSLRANMNSWKAWYASGLAYAAQGNLTQACTFWTVALMNITDDVEAGEFVTRTQSILVEIMVADRVAGRKFMLPYPSSMEYHCMRRFPDRKGYCDVLADSLFEASSTLSRETRFSLVNTCSLIRISSLKVHPDLKYHRDCFSRIIRDVDSFCFPKDGTIGPIGNVVFRHTKQLTLWLTMPYRVALNDTERVISDTTMDEIHRLGSLQPDDGTAGFVNHLMNAITVSADLAHMRSQRKRDEAKVSELEDRVFDEIRQYLDKYISGDPSPVPENKVYLESTLNPTLTSSR